MWQFVNVCHICDRIDRKAPERFFVQEIKCSFSFSALLEAVFAAARSRRWIIKPIINAMKLPFMVYSTLCQRVQSKVNGLKGGKLTVLTETVTRKWTTVSVQQWVILSLTKVLCRKVDGRERSLQLIGILEAVHFHQKYRQVEVFGLGSNLGYILKGRSDYKVLTRPSTLDTSEMLHTFE